MLVQQLGKYTNVQGEFNLNTGEVLEYPIIAKFNNMKLEIKGKRYIELTGSIHKYHYGYNYNDFSHNELIEAINLLYHLRVKTAINILIFD